MNVKKLSESAKIPSKASSLAAGYDLYATESHVLKPGERNVFKTGIALAIPEGTYGRIAPRSGLSVKHGIDVLAGVIDADYRGELLVALVNHGDQDVSLPIVKNGKETAIAQIIFEKYSDYMFTETDNLDETNRGSDGFGSTDVHKIQTKPSPKTLEDLLKNKESQTNVGQKYSEAIRERDSKIFNK